MNRRLHPHFFVLPLLAAFAIAAHAEDTKTLKAGALIFKYGKPWEDVSSGRPMRAGELKYDHTEEGLEDVEVVFYYFGPGQGGGIEANLQRWIGQFEGEPKVEKEIDEVDGHKIHYLYATGTYLDSGMGGPFASQKTPKPGYMMLAAIVESDQGAVFLKATAPEKSAEATKEAFKKVAASPFDD
ncbi:MAG: hypothetical protein KDN19_08000 [Verrucomicrobiae bacterium]|nr:hypothetical protein [Verrucomicrobiae bacterium]